METFKLKPKNEDVIVRDPVTLEPLDNDGEEKPQSAYWLRRIADGDVINISAPADKPKKKAKETK